MTKVLSSKNGLAQDAQRMFTLSDRTHASSISYYLSQFMKNVDYNTNKKNDRIKDLQDANLNMYIEHKEHGVVLDNDRILQNNRDIEWLQDQIEINDIFRAYILQASEQLFPEQHAKSEASAQAADKILADLEKQYKGMQKSA